VDSVLIKDFQRALSEISSLDRKDLREVYSGWATGQPFKASLELFNIFLSGISHIQKTFSRYLNKLRKGTDSKLNFIVGEFGSGKTQLMFYLSELAMTRYGFKSLYYSLEDKDRDLESLLFDLESKISREKNRFLLLIDHVESRYWRSDKPIDELSIFLSTLSATLGGHLGNRVVSVVLSLNKDWFELLKRYKAFRGGNYKISTLLDISREQETFIDHMMDASIKLLALHYVLSYYEGFKEKIIRYFDDISRFVYDMILRISRFGVKSMGLGLKMLNDRLVDFIKYITDNREIIKDDEIETAINVILTYIENRFNDLVLTFDRPWGFSRYRIWFEKKVENDLLGYLKVESILEDHLDDKIKGEISLFASNSTNIKEAEKIALEHLKDEDFVAVFHFFKKKRGIREEIEKIYLRNSTLMANFTIIPIDLNILKFAYKLKSEGYPIFVEKNTTAKRDLEEAVNTLVNIRMLEYINNIPREKQTCEHIVLALYLWAQSWLTKSGFCRVKRRDISTIKTFFINLFPNSIMNVDRNEIIKKIIRELEKDRIIFMSGSELIISNKVNDELVLKKIVEVARKIFC